MKKITHEEAHDALICVNSYDPCTARTAAVRTVQKYIKQQEDTDAELVILSTALLNETRELLVDVRKLAKFRVIERHLDVILHALEATNSPRDAIDAVKKLLAP